MSKDGQLIWFLGRHVSPTTMLYDNNPNKLEKKLKKVSIVCTIKPRALPGNMSHPIWRTEKEMIVDRERERELYFLITQLFKRTLWITYSAILIVDGVGDGPVEQIKNGRTTTKEEDEEQEDRKAIQTNNKQTWNEFAYNATTSRRKQEILIGWACAQSVERKNWRHLFTFEPRKRAEFE